MWYTTRQEGFDDPRHTKRGPCINLNNFIGISFRVGLSLEILSLTALYLTFWAFGGFGLFGYDLKGLPEEARLSETFRNLIVIWSGLYLVGAYYIMSFQMVLADDTCWSRGYRAGSKILRMATFFDVLSALLQFMFYLYVAKFYSTKWFQHFEEGGSEWVYFTFARILHSIALVSFAVATYLLEVYHDEGAGDLHAYINSVLVAFAGFLEFLVIFFKFNSLSTGVIWLSLLAVTIWSFFFEPEVNFVSPALHETELTNDVEIQVEKFARQSPFLQQEVPNEQMGYVNPTIASTGNMANF